MIPFHLFFACCALPILVGQNHLHKSQAHTNHAAIQVYFADPQLNFSVKCCDANPPDAFPSMRNQSSSSASLVSPSTNVTCLLTAMPTPSHHSSHIQLSHGFNLVRLCLAMTVSLVGSSLFVYDCHYKALRYITITLAWPPGVIFFSKGKIHFSMELDVYNTLAPDCGTCFKCL